VECQARLTPDGVPGKAHSRWSARQGSLQIPQGSHTKQGTSASRPAWLHATLLSFGQEPATLLPPCRAGQAAVRPTHACRPCCCRPAMGAMLLRCRLLPAGHAAAALPCGPRCCASGSCLQATLAYCSGNKALAKELSMKGREAAGECCVRAAACYCPRRPSATGMATWGQILSLLPCAHLD